jgi:hypothetical protein
VPAAGFERECVQLFAEVVQVFGVPRSVGQIYGLLYGSPQPLAFSDIVARLEISKGSVSQGLQLLRALGAINSTPVDPAEASAKRAVTYEPELSLRRLVSGILHERVAPFAGTGSERLARLRELAERAPGPDDFYKDRVRQLSKWRQRLKTVLPLLNVLLGPKSRS